MCNRILNKEGRIKEIILDNQNTLKHIDEWVEIVNNTLPPLKKLTKRSIAHMINIIGRKEEISLRRESKYGSVFYGVNLV